MPVVTTPLPAPTPPTPTVADLGVNGTGARLTLRHDGVSGAPSVRVALVPGRSTFAFNAGAAVRATRVGNAYRIGAWLRSAAPGVTVCLRIEEVTKKDPLRSVRTTETCVAPTTEWRHFRILRRTIAAGDKLVFSVYSYGAVGGDSFEISGFIVMRKTADGWKRVDEAFRGRRPQNG